MIATSRMSGTSSMVVRPAASSAAAMSLRALFFAPVTRTRPVRAVPPVTSKHSTGSPYGGPAAGPAASLDRPPAGARRERSEEHTSELQSCQYLVCRLLLEKKKERCND